MVAAADRVEPDRLIRYALELGWAAALRRIGSIADALSISGLAGELRPLRPPTADLDLEPGVDTARVWRDARWYVRWPQTVDELTNVVSQ